MGRSSERPRPGAVVIPSGAPALAIVLRVLGPGYLVAVGYLDPGNWATDLAAGS
ncbi:MAG: divalent metal cation transporter, partial [Cyanobacteriota bacterium]